MTSERVHRLLENSITLAEASARIASGKSPFGRFLIPQLVPAQGLAVVYGPTGTGKSFLAIHIGICVAAGLRWADNVLDRGTIVYLAAEDRFGIEARAVAAAQHLGVKIDDLPFEIASPPNIHASHWAVDVVETLRQLGVRHSQPVRLVVLDTLGAVFSGESQDEAGPMSRATGNLIRVAEEFGCAVLTIHHSGKDADRGHRGSQVLKDRADAFIRLKLAAGSRIIADLEKARNCAGTDNLSFRLEPFELRVGGRAEKTMVLADLTIGKHLRKTEKNDSREEPQDSGTLPRDAQICWDTLRGMSNGNGKEVPIKHWRTQAYKALGNRKSDALRQAFNLGKQRLRAAKLIELQNDTVRICGCA